MTLKLRRNTRLFLNRSDDLSSLEYARTRTHTHPHFWKIIIYQHWVLTLDKQTTVLDIDVPAKNISKDESAEYSTQ